MARLRIVAAVIDGAKRRPSRPTSEFLVPPAWPIREMYLDRFLINLVWFARNYLNIILISAALASFYYPLFVLTLACATAVHFSPPTTPVRIAFKAAQLASCAYVYWQYGIWPPLLTSVFPMLLISAHAIFIPYTDDALTFYNDVVSQCGEECAQPRTPVQAFLAKTDTQFAVAAAAGASGGAANARNPPPLELDDPRASLSSTRLKASTTLRSEERERRAGAEVSDASSVTTSGIRRQNGSVNVESAAPASGGRGAGYDGGVPKNVDGESLFLPFEDGYDERESPQLAVSTPAMVPSLNFERSAQRRNPLPVAVPGSAGRMSSAAATKSLEI